MTIIETGSHNPRTNLPQPTLYFLTDSNSFFGQGLMPWQSLDTEKMAEYLSSCYVIKRITYEAIAEGWEVPREAIIFHSSSQRPDYKAYIDDLLLYLHAQGVRLIPSIHIVRCHENKGYQELYKRLRGVTSLNSSYYCGLKNIKGNKKIFPLVLKEISGFGSSHVHLVRNQHDLFQLGKGESKYTLRELIILLRRQLGYVVRKYVFKKKNLRPYGDYLEPQKRFILQNFIAKLDFDYKVIAFQRRCFVLRRNVRPGDFKASGSGLFDFVKPPASLLNFARNLLLKFNEPYLAMDICFDGVQYFLLEYQGVHFGPYTVINAPFHYIWDDEDWSIVEGGISIEDAIAESLHIYINDLDDLGYGKAAYAL